ncbi:hypothetical protein JW848_07690 [Candidatus Bipolaricaulota bacterium]|nr:hypothetical protein [Candidatus Bipolaricaulota bacterium]
MNKMRHWTVGLTIVSLLAIGVVAAAGSGFGGSTVNPRPQAATGDCDLHERDADGDGILNSVDSDWVRPMDGSGNGEGMGYGQRLSASRPLDGNGFGDRQRSTQGQRGCRGSCEGDCL